MPGAFHPWYLFLTPILLMQRPRPRETEKLKFTWPGSAKCQVRPVPLCSHPLPHPPASVSPRRRALRGTERGLTTGKTPGALGAICPSRYRLEADLRDVSLLFFPGQALACLTSCKNDPRCEFCLPKFLSHGAVWLPEKQALSQLENPHSSMERKLPFP